MADEARSDEEMPNRRSGEAGAQSVAADNELIALLNPNDVLLGRGTGYNEYSGNRRFRAIVEEHKEEYMSAGKRDDKKTIATKVFDRISQSGGRFLRRTNKKVYKGRVVQDGAWSEVKVDIALEKCKQALRQHREETSDEASGSGRSGSVSESFDATSSSGQNLLGMSHPMAPLESSTLPTHLFGPACLASLGMTAGNVASSDVDSRLLLFLTSRLALQQQPQLFLQPPLPGVPSTIPSASHALLQNLHVLEFTSRMGQVQASVLNEADPATYENAPTSENIGAAAPHHQEQSSASQPVDTLSDPNNEDAVFALSALAVAGRPKFTEEQTALELATLTDEEQMAVLTDKFGKMCTVSDRQSKRPRRDLDQASIDFLVGQMKLELSRIPDDQKRALLEAIASCSPDEFSDARMTQFLRCEGMNVKLAAQRFVNYWQCRMEVFGPEKFRMRMTLSEALRDDIPAIEAGVLCLLPYRDVSGRKLLFLEPHRRTSTGYTSESLLRAFWYIIECTAQENNDVGSGCVFVGWDKETTMWDFPRQVYDRFIEFEKSCFPVRFHSVHSCCPTSVIMKVMAPVLRFLTDKRTRTRIVTHDVPESQILSVLSTFGITKSVLPTVMGGDVELNQSEWIADRRAVELQEI